MVLWIVTVMTGDEVDAGTTAKVYIQLHGENGWTIEHELKNNGGDHFQRNSTDRFINQNLNPDVGTITELKVWHDDSGTAPGWLLNEIRLTREGEHGNLTFPCFEWLSVTKGDHQIVRTLKPQ